MKTCKTDLHIHTLLSPCGSLEMSPDKIISQAVARGLDTIGITDHNSTRQCEVLRNIGIQSGIEVLMGAEVTTREEVHCLVYFENSLILNRFQQFLDEHLPELSNDPDRFGYQVVVNDQNTIVYEEPRLLINALDVSLEQMCTVVHSLEGVIIPAHIDRYRFGLIGQLGFIPADLRVDGFEISALTEPEYLSNRHPVLSGCSLIRGSDAHSPEMIGCHTSLFRCDKLDFRTFKSMLRQCRNFIYLPESDIFIN